MFEFLSCFGNNNVPFWAKFLYHSQKCSVWGYRLKNQMYPNGSFESVLPTINQGMKK